MVRGMHKVRKLGSKGVNNTKTRGTVFAAREEGGNEGCRQLKLIETDYWRKKWRDV